MNIWQLKDKLKKLVDEWNRLCEQSPEEYDEVLEAEGLARLTAFEIFDLITDAAGNRIRGLSCMIGRWVSRVSSGDAHVWFHDDGTYVGGASAPSIQEAVLNLFAPGSATLKALQKHFPNKGKKVKAPKRKLAKASRVAGSRVVNRKTAKRPLAKRKKK